MLCPRSIPVTRNRTRVATVCLQRVVVIRERREGGEEGGEERTKEEKAER